MCGEKSFPSLLPKEVELQEKNPSPPKIPLGVIMRPLDAAALNQVLANLVEIQRLRIQAADEDRRAQRRAQEAQAALAVRRRRVKRFWMRPWTTGDQRLQFSGWHKLINNDMLRVHDVETYFNYLRMSPALFDEILTRVGPRITKQDTRFRKALDPGLKLAATLRHLAAGDLYPSLGITFRISRHTIANFVPEVCAAIREEYAEEVMTLPEDPDTWREVAQEFQTRWNVPHALGALDGKHFRIRKPANSGSLYHNYKGFFSLVLMALVDADYKFMWCDVGGIGHQSDCQIWNHCQLKAALDTGALNLPAPDPLPNDPGHNTSYFILGDDAFPLRRTMMKPFAGRGLNRQQRLYNYRISRGRRVVENAFGILTMRYQCFVGCMRQSPRVVKTMLHACVCLHNLMRLRNPAEQNRMLDREDENHQRVDGAWRNWRIDAQLVPIDRRARGNRDLENAKVQRTTLMHYFNSAAGSVPWQDTIVPPAQPV